MKKSPKTLWMQPCHWWHTVRSKKSVITTDCKKRRKRHARLFPSVLINCDDCPGPVKYERKE